MIKIAHRGNTKGPSNMENHPEYILSAISEGYDVEIDVWNIDELYYLGHDKPQYLVGLDFLNTLSHKTWIHCKNLSALHKLSLNSSIRCFWHQEDDYSLTSNGYIWTYPGKKITNRSILVDLDLSNINTNDITPYGICSDYVSRIK